MNIPHDLVRSLWAFGLFPPFARTLFFLPVVLLILISAAPAHAHPISLTNALIDVARDKVTIELDVMVEDLVLYYELDHDEAFRFPLAAIKAQAHEHRAFLLRHLQLRDADGEQLAGEIVDIDFSKLDDEGIHIDDLMGYSIIYEFEYPLDAPLDFLTVFQNFGGSEPIVPAEMEVWVFQSGVRIGAPVQLGHGSAHSVHFDWEAEPDKSGSDLDAARREVRERDQEDLGITSYGSVYGYIYITETQVRHELLIPLLTLETWFDVKRDDPDRIGVAEQATVAEALFDFLRRHNFVRINGRRVRPRLDRVDFFGPGIRDFAAEVTERPVSVYNARVGVILSFPAEAAPERVEIEWHHFTEPMPYYRPRLYAFDREMHDVLFDPYLTRFEWESDEPRDPVELVVLARPEPMPRLRLPMMSLLIGGGALAIGVVALGAGAGRGRLVCLALAGGVALGAVAARSYGQISVPHPFEARPQLDDDEAEHVFAALHGNIYRAFERHDEQRIYDALERSVAGPLLEALYLQIRRGLEMREQGGAVSRVSEIEIVDIERRAVPGTSPLHQAYEYRCTWNVTGTVEHWGHIHTRKNQYEAVFRVEGLASGWKITDFQPLQEQRLEVRTRLRG